MKNLTTWTIGLMLVILLVACKRCKKEKMEEYYTTASTPPKQQNLTLADGFFGKCSMGSTGTNDTFKIKVKVRGISGLDANGNPVTYIYRSYVWPGISNSISNYTNTIEIPNTGGFFIDVSAESNSCVKCCTKPTSCPPDWGNVELAASVLLNGTVTVPNPIVIPADSFTQTCY